MKILHGGRALGILSGGRVILLAFAILLGAASARAEEDIIKVVEAKRIELKEKEEALRREEARLASLRKEVDDKIALYNRVLAKIEAVLKKVESAKDDRIENVVKAYEVMPAEDAAARLAALDRETALKILTRMKSKKAGAVIAAMEPRKAAALTRGMAAPVAGARRQ